VDFDEYERKIKPLQSKLQLIQQAYLGTRQHAVIALEGRDAAGKGGVVRRLGWTLDPRSFKVHPIAAPTPHQKMQHYMQRFWRRLPNQGQIVVFDRSWYGRVLVERVEGFAAKSEWKRAYREINDFERTLIDDGAHIAKVFLHITAEEQAKRFKDRLANPLKRWKLSYEDFRNRDSWKEYTEAIEDMMEKTSTDHAHPGEQQELFEARGVQHPYRPPGARCGSVAEASRSEARGSRGGTAFEQGLSRSQWQSQGCRLRRKWGFHTLRILSAASIDPA
jgi:AMP-polyphosphate phosphotransferase